MSGLYSIVFGENPFGQQLVELLQLIQPFDVGRYRDAWVEHESDRLLIRIHTRNGGGNREDYDDGSMQLHPWYVRDADGEFDNTYADYWFAVDMSRCSEELGKVLMVMATDPVDMDARWTEALRQIGAK